MSFSTIRRLLFRRWAILSSLFVFLHILAQPQFSTLYHSHQGGDHVHVHADLHLTPAASHSHPHHHEHFHHHAHPHHQHSHADDLTPSHPKTDHSSLAHTTPTYRSAPVHSNAHWHTSITLYPTTLASTPPSSPGARIQPLTPEEHTFSAFSPPQYYQARAPPLSF